MKFVKKSRSQKRLFIVQISPKCFEYCLYSFMIVKFNYGKRTKNWTFMNFSAISMVVYRMNMIPFVIISSLSCIASKLDSHALIL